MSMMYLPGLLFLLVLVGESDAHIPRPCAEAIVQNKTSKCCPDYKGSPCGFDSDRGQCVPLISQNKIWPPPVFTHYCDCNDPFDSYDCSQCNPGYSGENCTVRQHYVRKEITTLSMEEKLRLNRALQKAKNTKSDRYVILTREFDETELIFENASVYNLFVWMHYFAGKAAAPVSRSAAHEGPAFPFWHRYYLLLFEREIRYLTGDDSFYIPYWDWTKASNCNICTNDLMGESNKDGTISNSSVFSDWKTVCTYDDEMHPYHGKICVQPEDSKYKPIIRRSGTKNCTRLPTAAHVEKVLRFKNYDTTPYNRSSKNSFRNGLEGFDLSMKEQPNCHTAMHNLVHDFFNGTMSDVEISANDPMFMLHHANVDRLFEKWLDTHGYIKYPVSDDIPPVQRATSYMRPFFPPVLNNFLVNIKAKYLGYSYA